MWRLFWGPGLSNLFALIYIAKVQIVMADLCFLSGALGMPRFDRPSTTQTTLDFYRLTIEVQLAIYNGVVLSWREKVIALNGSFLNVRPLWFRNMHFWCATLLIVYRASCFCEEKWE